MTKMVIFVGSANAKVDKLVDALRGTRVQVIRPRGCQQGDLVVLSADQVVNACCDTCDADGGAVHADGVCPFCGCLPTPVTAVFINCSVAGKLPSSINVRSVDLIAD